MVNYKTGGLDGQTAEEAVKRYWPQLEAYAVGLHQSDPDRRVDLALYFTATGDSRTRRYDSAALDKLEANMSSQVGDL